ncbi:hypothetical protein [Nostoc sp.]
MNFEFISPHFAAPHNYDLKLINLSNRIQESGVRIQLGILYDWWMNNRV